ncbi:MAG: RHS repeat-associated core domain-containing protein [Limisphaera sp.]|nr:RHS repeat-associated core domain-containing protein [Limisphaera sp.]
MSGTLDGAGGVGGLLWVTLHTGTASGTHFCAYDGNGNVAALVQAQDGTVSANYEYGPFGEPIRVSGPAARANPFRFSTKRTGDTTDLVLYEYRAYSPSLGRWLSRDPIGERGGKNLYAFVANDPRNHVDVLGLQPCRKLGKISWGFSANIATGIYVGWDASGDLEKCGCCYTANVELGLEVGIGAKFRRQGSATVNIPGIGPVGVYFGIDAVLSLAQQRTHANATVTWCPGEISGGGKVYLIDLELGPHVGISGFGGG